ncbi:MorD protein, partial [Mycolicibacterium thermoresistibile]
MPELDEAHAMATERSCALTAMALSDGRRTGARLVSGQHRGFGLSSLLDVVHVPYPPRRD